MTDADVLTLYKELLEYYGDNLPNPEHYPIQFAQCVKLWKYYKGR